MFSRTNASNGCSAFSRRGVSLHFSPNAEARRGARLLAGRAGLGPALAGKDACPTVDVPKCRNSSRRPPGRRRLAAVRDACSPCFTRYSRFLNLSAWTRATCHM